MEKVLLIEILNYLKKLLYIWSKMSKGWIVQYIGGKKFVFLKKVKVID